MAGQQGLRGDCQVLSWHAVARSQPCTGRMCSPATLNLGRMCVAYQNCRCWLGSRGSEAAAGCFCGTLWLVRSPAGARQGFRTPPSCVWPQRGSELQGALQSCFVCCPAGAADNALCFWSDTHSTCAHMSLAWSAVCRGLPDTTGNPVQSRCSCPLQALQVSTCARIARTSVWVRRC